MFEKFGEFDSCEEINRAAKAQLEEGDLEAIRTITEENGLDPEDAEDFCTGAIEELRKDIEGVCEPCIWFDRMQGDPKNLVGVYIL